MTTGSLGLNATLFETPPPVGESGLAEITIEKLAELQDAPHPFAYQGSKRALAHAVLRYLPNDTETLVEPFAGSAAISIAARHSGIVGSTIINDVNAPLMAMWSRIIKDPDALAKQYESMWEASLDDPKAYFFDQRAEFNRTNDPALLLYLLNRIVKGAVRYSKTGDFNQSADNRRLGAKPATVRKRLLQTSNVMKNTTVLNGSYESLLIGAGRKDVVYMDPPYQGVTNVADHRYMSGLVREDFERALSKANDNGVSYIVSYDEVREDNKYGERLSEDLNLTHLHIIVGRSSQATLSGRTDVTTESLYLSPALASRLSDINI
ncbi:Dam family site-specific DNA-(adenine-N6)-methyltransferase [Streptomyces sp. NPDC058045]|uniref:Dam family site-specific DNA-(adenine-N6)-methyltransferase n=1 Tax=Streptomyces sp. NPDC058045 TaxID=3346311 RepID=UPI0036E57DB9